MANSYDIPRFHSFGLGITGLALALLAGIAMGIGGYTFVYAKGLSYLTSDPAACANCHIMQSHYDAWVKSSHRTAAACNDCHTPQGLIGKYWTKAEHGFWHSYGFSTGNFHEPIFMKRKSREIVERSCRKCHWQIVEEMEAVAVRSSKSDCLRCHAGVGHPL